MVAQSESSSVPKQIPVPDIDLSGVGSDLVDIDRFRKVLLRRPSITRRLFTGGELEYANQASDPAARLAARFAAKEATLKALGFGLGGIRMVDIEVVRTSTGRPELELHGLAGLKAAACGVRRWQVTLSHTDHLALATVLALS